MVLKFFLQILLIACFGALGAVLRALLSFETLQNLMPAFILLVINLTGSFGLGFLQGYAPRMKNRRLADLLSAGLGIGFFGSFTTFSALTAASLSMTVFRGVFYMIFTIVLGIAAALLGLICGERKTVP